MNRRILIILVVFIVIAAAAIYAYTERQKLAGKNETVYDKNISYTTIIVVSEPKNTTDIYNNSTENGSLAGAMSINKSNGNLTDNTTQYFNISSDGIRVGKTNLETRHYIYGGIAVIMIMQLIILVLVIRCKRKKIYKLSYKELKNV